MLKIVLFIFLSIHSIIFASSPNNQLPPEKMKILQTALNAQGYVDEQLYINFWKGVSQAEKAEVIKIAEGILDISVNFQTLFWEDVILSIKQNKVLISPITQKYLDLFKSRKEFQQVSENSLKLIEHAVSKKPFSHQGTVQYITLDLAEKTLNNLNAGKERMKLILSDKWNPQPKERSFNYGVKVLWHMPFIYEAVKADNGLMTHGYTSSISENEAISISLIQTNNSKIEQKQLNQFAKELLMGFGVDSKSLNINRFNGLISAESTELFMVGTQKKYISLKTIAKNNLIISVVSISNNSFQASDNLSVLVKNLQL